MQARTFAFRFMAWWFIGVLAAGTLYRLLFLERPFPRFLGPYWVFIACVMTFLFVAVYIYDVFHNPRLSGTDRTAWALLLLAAGPLLMPVYFARFIRPSKAPTAPPAGSFPQPR
ncbi:MAG: hypothetical protein WCC53_01140 [Thermoanaerobaculia bacterium]